MDSLERIKKIRSNLVEPYIDEKFIFKENIKINLNIIWTLIFVFLYIFYYLFSYNRGAFMLV